MPFRLVAVLLIGPVLLAGCNFSAAAPSITPLPGGTSTGTPGGPDSTWRPTPVSTRILTSPTPSAISTPTPTPLPSDTPPPTATTPPTAVAALPFNAQVAAGRGGLRLRTTPDDESAWIANLVEFAPLNVIGQSDDGLWLHVSTAEGYTGWVWASYVVQNVDWSQAPPTAPAAVAAMTSAAYFQGNAAPPPVAAISGITGHARQIFLRGQALGNRPDVFSKVGDSLTVATYVLFPFGWGSYDLGEYSYLYPALSYFSSTVVRDGRSSFANDPLAADDGWTTASVLDPARADSAVCLPAESPLVCEYRVVRPAVALILFGSNDVVTLSGEQFAANLARIVEITVEMGVIPVLTTIPTRRGYEGQVQQFNGIVTATARSYDVPLLDYASALAALPDMGLSADGLHPSWPPGDYSEAARLTPPNLQYGYTVRNLTALQVLDAVWRNALY